MFFFPCYMQLSMESRCSPTEVQPHVALLMQSILIIKRTCLKLNYSLVADKYISQDILCGPQDDSHQEEKTHWKKESQRNP